MNKPGNLGLLFLLFLGLVLFFLFSKPHPSRRLEGDLPPESPHVTSWQEAPPYSLPLEGKKRKKMILPERWSLAGKVMDIWGRPLSHGVVQTVWEDFQMESDAPLRNDIGPVKTKSNGSYLQPLAGVLKLPETRRLRGFLRIHAFAPGFAPSPPLTLRPPFELPLKRDFYLESGGRLRGQVVDHRRKGVQGAEVELTLWDFEPPEEGGAWQGAYSFSRRTDRFGSYEFGILREGCYSLTAIAPNMGKAKIKNLQLHPKLMKRVPDLILQGRGGAWLAGRVVDPADRPLAGMTLKVRVTNPDYRIGRKGLRNGTARTDKEGRLNLTRLRRGLLADAHPVM